MRIKNCIVTCLLALALVLVGSGATTNRAEAGDVYAVLECITGNQFDKFMYIDVDSVRAYPNGDRYEAIIYDGLYRKYNENYKCWIIFVRDPQNPKLYKHWEKIAPSEFGLHYSPEDIPASEVLASDSEYTSAIAPAMGDTTLTYAAKLGFTNPERVNVSIMYSVFLRAVIDAANGKTVHKTMMQQFFDCSTGYFGMQQKITP